MIQHAEGGGGGVGHRGSDIFLCVCVWGGGGDKVFLCGEIRGQILCFRVITCPGGGDTLIFSSYLGSGPASILHPPPQKKKKSEI